MGGNGWGSVPLNLNTDSTPLWRESQSKILAESTGANTSFLHIFSLVGFNRKKIFSKVQTSMHSIFSPLERLFLAMRHPFSSMLPEWKGARDIAHKKEWPYLSISHSHLLSQPIPSTSHSEWPKLLGFVPKQKGFPSLCHYPAAGILVQAHLGLICMLQGMAPLQYLMTVWSPEYQLSEKQQCRKCFLLSRVQSLRVENEPWVRIDDTEK